MTVLTGAITRCRNLVVDTRRTYVGRTRQHCRNIHQMIVTANRKTCVLLAAEDMIAQRINTHLAGILRATPIGRGQASWGWRPQNSCRKKPAKRLAGSESMTFALKGPTEKRKGSS